MTDNKIKLNHLCIICLKKICIDDGTIIYDNPFHFQCFYNKGINQGKKEEQERIGKIIYFWFKDKEIKDILRDELLIKIK